MVGFFHLNSLFNYCQLNGILFFPFVPKETNVFQWLREFIFVLRILLWNPFNSFVFFSEKQFKWIVFYFVILCFYGNKRRICASLFFNVLKKRKPELGYKWSASDGWGADGKRNYWWFSFINTFRSTALPQHSYASSAHYI